MVEIKKELEVKISEIKSEMIKWTLGFIAGQTVLLGSRACKLFCVTALITMLAAVPQIQ